MKINEKVENIDDDLNLLEIVDLQHIDDINRAIDEVRKENSKKHLNPSSTNTKDSVLDVSDAYFHN